MGPFGKKKKTDNMKPLSEEEIQKKLYGFYKKSHAQPNQDEEAMIQIKDQDEGVTDEEESMAFGATEEDLFTISHQDETEKKVYSSADDESLELEDDATELLDEKEEKEEDDDDDDDIGEATEDSEETEDSDDEEENGSLSEDDESENKYATIEHTFAKEVEGSLAEDDTEEDETEEEADDDEEDDNAEVGDVLRFQDPEYKITSDEEAIKKPTAPMTQQELDEHIFEENKTQETVTYSYDEPEQAPPSTFTKTQNVNVPSFQEVFTSIKIDIAEFIDKVKSIPPSTIIIGISIIVFLIIVFNMWSRASSREGTDSLLPSAAIQETTMTEETPSILQTINTAQIDESTSNTLVNVPLPEAQERISESSVASAEAATMFYAIQICVYESVDRAQALITYFTSKGVDSFYKKTVTQSGRQFFTVYIGKFKTMNDATSGLSKFKGSEDFQDFPDSFIKWIK